MAIGSCTNSSYTDLMKVAAILKGKKVHPDVSLVISPGSSKILEKMAENGALADIISAGARIIENACGPCIGMGQSPKSGAVSLTGPSTEISREGAGRWTRRYIW